MTGPSLPLDSRIHAFRHDLADIALAGRIIASHYARPLTRSCGAHSTYVRRDPDPDAEAVSELLPGEPFAVLEYAAGWAWGYCGADHIVGYVEAIGLTDPLAATHIVCERCAPVAADDQITSPLLATLPMGARLHGEEHGACLTTEYGCVSLSHLRRVDEHDSDPVTVAERLIGAPFLPGGRSHYGIDGAGLVQLCLGLCGFAAPRLPEQMRALGGPLPQSAPLRRGDLVLFDHHAGLMIDDLLMIHASPHAGKVTVDPVAMVEGPGLERRRLPI
ncbi:NlpC/P60 family protein [Sphingosinicella sp. CPCC 101087]|uniref:C40 family peptidase n=1 Tax=Sphingosinicella sp. CPCC 101087 TaxID=2497754 RepID=UPI00101B6AA9|nr:NlpC/P60 family protein [Sphingosinicella sp. CPCC 101087]